MNPENPSKPARILVIEDEEAIRVPLVDTLEDEGFEVLEAADGERGLALALTEDPDLILLDLMLPKVDGFTILRDIRRDRVTAPVVILSAWELARITRARPDICSDTTGLRLCGMADEPFCLLEKNSSTSRTSVR